ncbi:hypothetical protein G7048_03725 [Diaphorobacter sp. HDW4B]|uniref:phage tail length tape measure family protein n=1 Tax=Diaphorobacter sp. HDW4B TaxID=2714925 RepID=UPI0014099D59|nr:phage tail length tape measure family protein [Diaphorobacter sp. HDW4B]QIL69560.1 hypothetical protein G7048_03725 [Diaphorobacter sp. HDW4B]
MALRGVPAQLTDIIVSLQGGQAPMTVMLQQGGQLRDMFGGLVPAIKALGGAFLGLLANPVTLTIAALAAVAMAYNSGSKEADEYRNAIILTGNAAGTTVSQLSSYAREISGVVGTQAAAAESLAAMAGSGKVTNDVLKEAAQAAVEYERATGTAATKTAEKFASLANEPLSAVLKLNEGTNFLTVSVYKQIKSLEEQGRTTEAAAAAQRAYADALTSRSSEITANLGYIERGWRAIKDAAKAGWDAMLNVGRSATVGEQLETARKSLDQRMQSGPTNELVRGNWEKGNEHLRQQIALLSEQERMMKRGAETEAQRAKNSQQFFEWEKQGDQFKSKAAKRDEEVRKAEVEGRELINAGLLTEAGLRERIADIKDKYKDKKSGAGSAGVGENEVAQIKARTEAQKQYLALLESQGAQADKLTEGEKLVIKIKEELKTSITGVARARKEDALVAAEALAAVDKQVAGEKERIAGLEKSKTEYAALIDETLKSAAALNQNAEELAASNAMYGKGKVAVEEYRLAVIRAKLAEVEGGSDSSYDPAYIAALYAKLDAQLKVVNETRAGEFKQINQHANELLANANAMAAAYKDEAALSGLTSVERAKIVALRQVELKYAKELDKIDQMEPGVGRDTARATVEQAKRIEGEAAVSKAIQDDWTKTTDQINQSLTDALLRGFESGKSMAENFRDTLKNMFNTLVLKPIISAVMAPISGLINTVVQGAMGAIGLGGGGSSGLGGLSNLASLGSSIYSMFTGSGGIMGTVLTGIKGLLGIGGGAAASGAYSGAATAVTGMIPSSGGASAGAFSGMSAAWPLAVIAGMFMSNKLYGQGINQFGRQGAGQALGIGNQIETSILGKIVGDKWANILTGAPVMTYTFNKMFGRTLKDAGVEGTVGGETGFEGRKFEYYKGGWFRSNKTKYSELDEETRSGLADMFGGVKDGVADMAESIGLSADSLDSFSSKLKISMMGLTDSEINTKVAEEFKRIADEMAAMVLASDEYTQGEETRSETLARLSTRMVAVNHWLDVMKDNLLEVSVVGADMASSLVDQFGGDDAFASSIQSFIGNYLSQVEQLDLVNKQVSESLKAIGVDSIPKTREELKALLNAQDLTTESGRKTYAALMGISDVLNTIYNAADQLATLNLDLDIELLKAQGKDTEALALEREKRIKELLPYGDAIIDKQRKIWEEQDKRAAEEAKKAAEAAAAEATRKAKEDAQNKAMRNLEQATAREVDRLNDQKAALTEQRSLANESLSLITGVFDLVRQNARDLYGTVESAAEMQALQGRLFIEQALGAAQSTGYLPEQEKLSEAISAARSGIDAGAYRSQVEKDYDTLLLAGKLSALQSISGEQKTTAELQLEALDQQITSIDKQTKYLQDQLSNIKELVAISKGEYDATISVEQAVRDIYKLYDLKTSTPTTGTTTKPGTTGPTVGNGAVAGDPVKSGPTGSGGWYREVVTGAGTTYVVDNSEELTSLDKWIDKWRGTGDVAGMLNDGKAQGYSMNDIAAVMGWGYQDLIDAGKRLGIPQFAVGTNYVPNDMLAMVHKGEAIIPAADNRALMAALQNGGSGSDGELLKEVRALREDNRAQAGEIVRLNLRIAKIVERWEGGGLPPQREEQPA